MPRPEPLDRRRFLKGAAAAIAAPLVIPSSALGLGQPAPSERIAVGHIGCGRKGGYRDVYFGSLLQECVGNPAARSLAVCDADRTLIASSKQYVDQQYGNRDCAAYVDFRELLARDDIDAVVIATPEHWHGVQAVMACQAGKDVYCEKPLALTIREARAIVTAARRYGRVVQTGSQSRSMDRLQFACEVVRSGRIGKVKRVFASCGGPSQVAMPGRAQPLPEHLDWDLWLGPAPWRPYNPSIHPGRGWLGMRDFGGGGMTDWGAHHFDIAQWGLGMDASGPVEVFPPGHDGHPGVSFRYATGTMLVHGGNGVIFEGETGKVWCTGLSAQFRFEPEEIGRNPLLPGERVFSKKTGNQSHVQNFLECVRSRAKPNADVEIGCRSVTVCHVGNICYWLKRPLKWDPVKESFIGDDEANRWLGRAMRAPWHV
jgi:predicted dehydrogenase